MAYRVGVVLSGCGVQDGSEIHEAVSVLLALDLAGAQAVIMAPDTSQVKTMNHRFGEPMSENRNVVIESARIARGNIKIMKYVNYHELDAIIFPGGFGAVMNLCNFNEKGVDCVVNPQVERLILECNDHNKPIGAICISPVIIAKVLGRKGVKVTIGDDQALAEKITAMGAQHRICGIKDIVVDEKLKVVTAPAYMLAPSIKDCYNSVEMLVNKIINLIGS